MNTRILFKTIIHFTKNFFDIVKPNYSEFLCYSVDKNYRFRMNDESLMLTFIPKEFDDDHYFEHKYSSIVKNRFNRLNFFIKRIVDE